jgi:NAD(P)-dependent dehydrogenase (short-subunit alcohol dehydrogenase family)
MWRPQEHCYICKAFLPEGSAHRHRHYQSFCQPCGQKNWGKREQRAYLDGRIALVTGARIKIGFECALKLLRDGGVVIATTRFPGDTFKRYQAEPDFASWHSRLHIVQVDFVNFHSVARLVSYVQSNFSHLDILINNAAQTIARPKEYYTVLSAAEDDNIHCAKHLNFNQLHLSENDSAKSLIPLLPAIDPPSTSQGQKSINSLFPGQLDEEGQPIDLRHENSWVAKIDEISLHELLEVQLINLTVPFLLIGQFKPMIMRSPNEMRFIINVSAKEGQFNTKKNAFHAHTNAAKAGLNMITRTISDDYRTGNILVNSVDTGWVTNEYPYEKKAEMKTRGFSTPLDSVDGAARIVDPIYTFLLNGKIIFGRLLKDYEIAAW